MKTAVMVLAGSLLVTVGAAILSGLICAVVEGPEFFLVGFTGILVFGATGSLALAVYALIVQALTYILGKLWQR